jgi:hypothetical protein
VVSTRRSPRPAAGYCAHQASGGLLSQLGRHQAGEALFLLVGRSQEGWSVGYATLT